MTYDIEVRKLVGTGWISVVCIEFIYSLTHTGGSRLYWFCLLDGLTPPKISGIFTAFGNNLRCFMVTRRETWLKGY